LNRTNASRFATIGIRYNLNPDKAAIVKEFDPRFLNNPEFNKFYSKKSIHLGFGAKPIALDYHEVNEGKGSLLISNFDAEYFIANRISVGLGHIGARTTKGTDDFIHVSDDKYHSYLAFYPKLMRGIKRFSISANVGLSYVTASGYQPSNPTDIENNWKFGLFQVSGGYTFIYKPMKLFKKDNERFSLQFRTSGALYSLNKTAKFWNSSDPFEVFGSGASRGLIVRLVTKI
jgi:hypothetical protein